MLTKEEKDEATQIAECFLARITDKTAAELAQSLARAAVLAASLSAVLQSYIGAEGVTAILDDPNNEELLASLSKEGAAE